jgi:hypothetical protein
MSILRISLSEKGVLRVDVLYAGAKEYPQAAAFHKDLSQEIAKLDEYVRHRYQNKAEVAENE